MALAMTMRYATCHGAAMAPHKEAPPCHPTRRHHHGVSCTAMLWTVVAGPCLDGPLHVLYQLPWNFTVISPITAN